MRVLFFNSVNLDNVNINFLVQEKLIVTLKWFHNPIYEAQSTTDLTWLLGLKLRIERVFTGKA